MELKLNTIILKDGTEELEMTEQEIQNAYTTKQQEKRKIYLAGHMLSRGAQLQRAEEAEMVRKTGHLLYNPMENKEINDKATAKQEGLAERIVRHDTDAIKLSDTIIIEPLPEALGTVCELGQIHGMKMMAATVKKHLEATDWSTREGLSKTLSNLNNICNQTLKQEVYPHYEDIRRVEGITETGDRRSLGINQFVYGVVLELTNGKGFYSMDEIREILTTK